MRAGTSPSAGADDLQAFATRLQLVLQSAPFGDSPPSATPPYSATQLSEWARARVLRNTGERLPTLEELEAAWRGTLLSLEAFSRSRLELSLALLSAQLEELQHKRRATAEIYHGSSPRAVVPNLERLMLRHGADALNEQLRELPPAPAIPAALSKHSLPMEEASAILAPVKRLAQRESGWRGLLQTEIAASTGADPLHCLAGLPGGEVSDGSPTLFGDGAVRGEVSTALQSGSAVFPDTADERHVQLQVRLVCSSPGPQLIEGLVVDEAELTNALPPQFSTLATREVHFSPPILLKGQGSYMRYTLKLPASQDEDRAPQYRVQNVRMRPPRASFMSGEVVSVPRTS